MYIVLPLFLALYIGQSFHYLTPFLKKFIQECEEKKYEQSSANTLRKGNERIYELLQTGTVASEKSTAAFDWAEYHIKNFGSSFFPVEAGI